MGKFLTAVYTFGLTTDTLTIAQISESSLRVHSVWQPPIGNPVIRDDYFHPVGSPKPRRDLAILAEHWLGGKICVDFGGRDRI